MPVRSPNRGLIVRRRHRELWDGLTISLAIAIVFIGLLILFMPKSDSQAETSPKPSKEIPADMAQNMPALSGAPTLT